MSFIAKIFSYFLPQLLDWTASRISSLLTFLGELSGLKKDISEREKQAKIVEDLSAEIKALILAKKPVPIELKERFRAETRKLSKLTSVN